MEDEIARYALTGYICITGDMNARTAMKPDYVEVDKITDEIAGFTDEETHNKLRGNIDMKTNYAGLQLLNLCKITDMLILNGRVIGNLMGHYTFYSNNGCSVVDNTVTDKHLLKKILYHTIDSPSHLSDHCLQKLQFHVGIILRLKNTQEILNHYL